ncbi:hypothetical protein BOX15_Mlig034020g1, partial [Macrostomum lignano]
LTSGRRQMELSSQRFNSLATKEISQIVNVENAKRLALLLMVCFSAYHGVLLLKSGGDTCKWLLSEGRFQGYSTWQPSGCMAHKYSRQDLSMCLNYIAYWGGQNSIYFVGDSRMRALFSAFVELLSGSPAGPQRTELQSAPTKLRAVFKRYPRTDADLRSFLAALNRAPPQLVVLGHGLYQAANASMLDSLVRQFGANLSAALPQLVALRDRSKLLWKLQDPVDELAVNASRYASNGLINRLNEAARRVLDPSGISVWSSSRLIAEGVGFFNSSDGVSLSPLALNWDVQVLANFYCNNHMKYSDGTCCSVPEPVTISQLLTFAFFACWAVVAGLLCLFNAFVRKDGGRRLKPTYAMTHQRTGSDASPFSVIDSLHELACALAKLGLVLGYFFVCDRTSFFMKENKTFTALNFVIPLLYVLVLGLFFTDNSQYTQLLHRDVTDEWKGVAQLIILVYHMTSASQVLPVYMHIRVCVSSYLFLSGFGHMTYFWSRGFKGCLVRGLRVLFRMNVLVVCLCLVMNRPYQFYYFVPLVSHWFLVTFFMAVAWPRVCQATLDRRPGFTLAAAAAKLGVVVLLVSLLYASEYAFSKLFLSGPARSLFVASEDRSREWRFRWSLDRYSSLAGAAAAICIQAARHFRLLDDSHQGDLAGRGVAAGLSLVGLLACLSYTAFAVLCPSKQDCNSVHPLLVVLPILGYACVRNVWGSLRQRYSVFFAWFGRIALELFIAQYHVWLSNDTSGLLVLIPSNYVLNLITTSFIFVCLAHEVHSITRLLTPYAVPDDWRLAMRNLLIFCAVLVPIGVTHGAFSFS